MGPAKDTLWGRLRRKSQVCLPLLNSSCHLTNVISPNIHWAPHTKECNILCKKRKPTFSALKSLGKQAATFSKDEVPTATLCPSIVYMHLSGVNGMSIGTQGCELVCDTGGRKLAVSWASAHTARGHYLCTQCVPRTLWYYGAIPPPKTMGLIYFKTMTSSRICFWIKTFTGIHRALLHYHRL